MPVTQYITELLYSMCPGPFSIETVEPGVKGTYIVLIAHDSVCFKRRLTSGLIHEQ